MHEIVFNMLLLYTYFPRLAYSDVLRLVQLLWLYFQRLALNMFLIHMNMYVLINRFFCLDSHSNAFYCLCRDILRISFNCYSTSFRVFLIIVACSEILQLCYFLVTQSNQYVSSSFGVMEKYLLSLLLGCIPTSFLNI